MWQALAPEVFDSGTKMYTEMADIYCLALVYYELFIRMYPFEEYAKDLRFCKGGNLMEQTLKQAIISGLRPTIPKDFDGRVAEVINRCWKSLPHDRLTASEVVKHFEMIVGIPPNESRLRKEPVIAPSVENCELRHLKSIETGTGLLQQPAWSLLSVDNCLYVGCADGTLAVFEVSESCQLLCHLRIHNSEIYSLAYHAPNVWCSSCNGLAYPL